MKTKLVVGGGILAIVVIGGLGYALLRQEAATTTTSNVETVMVEGVGTPMDREPFSGLGTFGSLASLGKDLECQIVYETPDEGKREGTFFLSGQKWRGDFVIPAPDLGGTILSSMIQDDQTLYVWSLIDGQQYGFKTQRDTVVGTETSNKTPVPLSADVRYTCSTWSVVDNSVFVPPSEVTFTDATLLRAAGMEDGTLAP